MRTTSVFINKLGEHGFPFSGKIKFTLMSTDPDFLPTKKPVSAFFINGKAKVQLIPNIFISKNINTYYHYEIFAQHPVNSPTEVEFELIEEGDCIVPIKPSCLQEILIPPQSKAEQPVSNCQCEQHNCIESLSAVFNNPNLTITGTKSDNSTSETIVNLSDLIIDLTPYALHDDVVHKSGTETITGNKIFNAGYFGGVEQLTSGSIDVSHATAFSHMVEEDTEFTFSGVPQDKAACFSLLLNNAGGYNIAWPNNVKWCGGEEPEIEPYTDSIFTFMTFNGGQTWYGTKSIEAPSE